MMAKPETSAAAWPQAIATVTSCTYQLGAGRALAFGLPASRHFLIAFNYFVDDDLYTGQFSSSKAIPQSSLFPIRYNPEAPQENSRSDPSVVSTRAPALVVGIIGSVVLSLAWLALLHSCH